MDVPARVVHPILIVALVLAAVLGYLAGSHHVSTSTASHQDLGGQARLASGSGLLLEYPIGWEQAAVPGTIPGLTLTHTVGLIPRGTSGTGLISGVLPAAEPSPLPAAFLARLHGTPRAEVVSLLSAQAYRYTNLDLPGYQGTFELYVIPATSAPPRLLACYSPSAPSPQSQQCERIVSGLTLVGAAAPSITPEPTYAGSLAAIVTALDSARVQARTDMSHSSSATSVAEPAAALASRFSAAAKAAGALEPPQPAVAAQTALVSALAGAGHAYGILAEAARTESVGEYDSERGEVESAERSVDSALKNFALLGYGAT
ncbi:MAG: hypothetical protein ACLQBB_11075 [Solirubrobacteraceae bacterium]